MSSKKIKSLLLADQKGITVIEVLLVTVLLLVVLAPAFNALSASSRIWEHNESINPSIADANLTMSYIGKEIRQAAKPSKDEDALTISDEGSRMHLYKYNDGKACWEKIFYLVNNNTLKRIVLENADPALLISEDTPADEAGWQTLIASLADSGVFSQNPASRTVDINLNIADISHPSKPRFQPFSVDSTYMVRSTEIGAIHGDPVPDDSEPPDIPVIKAEASPAEITLYVIGDRSASAVAKIWPANATNKGVTWTVESTSWTNLIKVEPTDSRNTVISIIPSESDFGSDWDDWFTWPKKAVVKVTPNDENGKSSNIIITIHRKYWFW